MWIRHFVWNFKGYFWNSTQNILPIYWKRRFLYNVENLIALWYKSSHVFLCCHMADAMQDDFSHIWSDLAFASYVPPADRRINSRMACWALIRMCHRSQRFRTGVLTSTKFSHNYSCACWWLSSIRCCDICRDNEDSIGAAFMYGVETIGSNSGLYILSIFINA